MKKDELELKFKEFVGLSDSFLDNLLPELEKNSPAVVCYSFLRYLAATCIEEKNSDFFEKFIYEKFEDCLVFFHHQLDFLYENIKRGLDAQGDK